jgi:transposase
LTPRLIVDSGVLQQTSRKQRMWIDTTRGHHARAGLALPSNLTDAEWALLAPFLPPPSSVGRPRKWPMRRIVEAILYLLRGGLPWRMLPPCFPPVSTVRRWFYLWRDNGLWQTLNHSLLMATREMHGREASPSAGVIDSQTLAFASSSIGWRTRTPISPQR